MTAEMRKTVGEMHGLDGKAERRVLRLVNPAFLDLKNRRQRSTTHTMLMTMQLLKPGEVAHAHRHNFAAFRFIVKGAARTPSSKEKNCPWRKAIWSSRLR